MGGLRIRPADPGSDEIRPILEAHLAFSRAQAPQSSCHVMQSHELSEPGVSFWAIYRDGQAVGIGALKHLPDDVAEVKSVHVLTQARGAGLAERIMRHLEQEARAAGVSRLVLETGSEALPGFAAARRLYERLGYRYCDSIPGYERDPNSAFMTRAL